MSEQVNTYDSSPNGKIKLTDEQLMAYTEGRLNAVECRAVEELLSEESAEADALEGLQMMHPAESKRTIAELNRKLHAELLRNKAKRKNKFSEDYWSWIAIVIVLLLIVVGYIVVKIASK